MAATTAVLVATTVAAVGAAASGLMYKVPTKRLTVSLGAMVGAATLTLAWIAAPVAGVGVPPGETPPTPPITPTPEPPQIDSTTVSDGLSAIYAVDRTASEVEEASNEMPAVEDDCDSDKRKVWIQERLGGVPLEWNYVDTILGTRRVATVAIADVEIHAVRLPQQFETGVVPCPGDLGKGGQVYDRGLHIELQKGRARVAFFDVTHDQRKPLKKLTVAVDEDDVVRLGLEAHVNEPGVGYEWYATVISVSQGKREELRIPATGAYRVASLPESAMLWSDNASPRTCNPKPPRDEQSSDSWC